MVRIFLTIITEIVIFILYTSEKRSDKFCLILIYFSSKEGHLSFRLQEQEWLSLENTAHHCLLSVSESWRESRNVFSGAICSHSRDIFFFLLKIVLRTASSKGSNQFNCWSRSDHIFEWNHEYESLHGVWCERLLTKANSSRAEGQEGGAGQAAEGAEPSEDLANPSLGLDLNSNPPQRCLGWRCRSSRPAAPRPLAVPFCNEYSARRYFLADEKGHRSVELFSNFFFLARSKALADESQQSFGFSQSSKFYLHKEIAWPIGKKEKMLGLISFSEL